MRNISPFTLDLVKSKLLCEYDLETMSVSTNGDALKAFPNIYCHFCKKPRHVKTFCRDCESRIQCQTTKM